MGGRSQSAVWFLVQFLVGLRGKELMDAPVVLPGWLGIPAGGDEVGMASR